MPTKMHSHWAKGARHGALALAADAVCASLFIILRAAALILPRSWAYGLVDVVEFLLAVSPMGARARRNMSAAFPDQSVDRLAARWLSRPFRDHVAATRFGAHRERPDVWHVEMRNPPALLSDADHSFIMATGHFSREAMSCIYLPWVISQHLVTVMAPPTQTKTPRGLRVRLQVREMVRGIRGVRPDDADIAEMAGKSSLVRVLHHLRKPGRVALIASDASWGAEKGDGLTRPFAGYPSQTFALGTARLSRLSQTPIVPWAPYIVGDRQIVLEWGTPISPPPRHDIEADVRVTNEILDWIEQRIGERPDQYVQYIGAGRRWNSLERRWVDIDYMDPANDRLAPADAKTVKYAS